MDKENEIKMDISKRDNNKKDKNNWLKIIVPPTNKHKVKTTKAMDEHIIAKHPFRAVMSGCSGSGKSCLLLNLLSNKRMYANYFDIIFIVRVTFAVVKWHHILNSKRGLHRVKVILSCYVQTFFFIFVVSILIIICNVVINQFPQFA